MTPTGKWAIIGPFFVLWVTPSPKWTVKQTAFNSHQWDEPKNRRKKSTFFCFPDSFHPKAAVAYQFRYYLAFFWGKNCIQGRINMSKQNIFFCVGYYKTLASILAVCERNKDISSIFLLLLQLGVWRKINGEVSQGYFFFCVNTEKKLFRFGSQACQVFSCLLKSKLVTRIYFWFIFLYFVQIQDTVWREINRENLIGK